MYIEINDEIIQNTETGASIPKDEGNRDYQAYLEWLAAQEVLNGANS